LGIVGWDKQLSGPDISDLNYTVNDVTQFYDALVDSNVCNASRDKVFLMTDDSKGDSAPTHTNIVFRLGNLVSRIKPEDTFIFYFSGHGMVREGKQYLLTINSDPRSLDTLEMSALPLEKVRSMLKRIKARQILSIIDACRNDPEKGKGDSDNELTDDFAKGFQTLKQQEKDEFDIIATLFASSKGQRAYEWEEKKAGVFSYYLVDGLRGKACDNNKKVTLGGLYSYVKENVSEWSLDNGKQQIPWLVTDGYADITLVMPKNMPSQSSAVYRIDIESPEGAKIILDDKQTGQETPTIINVSEGQHILRLEKTGFQSYEKTVALNADHPLETINAIMSPIAQVETGAGMLVIRATADNQQTDAKVFIDGKEIGSAPYTNTSITTGAHEVRISKPLYHDYKETVAVAKDRRQTVNAILQPAFGSLEVSSTPSSAEVELTDAMGTRWGSGNTTFNMDKIASGDYKLSVNKSRYYTEKRDVSIRDGKKTTEAVTLKPKFGTLSVDSTPSGAKVLLAGKDSGKTPMKMDVDSGRYVLEIQDDIYLTWSNEIDIRDGEITRINQNLTPNYGTLDVQVTPNGAQILIDGKLSGKAPTQLKLSPGTHKIEVTQNGFVSLTQDSVFITQDQTETLKGTLEQKVGTLRLVTNPMDANITIDGKDYGQTPNVISLPEGTYKLKLSKKDFYEVEETIKIEWNKSLERNIDLPTVPPSIIGKDGAEMLLIPAGEFQMGSNDYDNEKPIHTVYLDAFYIDKYEVTNAQYKKFMDATGHEAPYYWNDSSLNAPNQPVVGVNWNDAKAYADWAGERLPTEAEWEKSARGGLVDKNYPWGNTLTHDDANYDGTGGKDVWDGTSPVGSFKPNGYGLYDMAGNVWEWCADWYGSNYYSSSPKSNPAGLNSGNTHVCRGGSWSLNDTDDLRVDARYDDAYDGIGLGFRCVRRVSE
jgi:formylglycine-generating enzyme required for sulfatase activity